MFGCPGLLNKGSTPNTGGGGGGGDPSDFGTAPYIAVNETSHVLSSTTLTAWNDTTGGGRHFAPATPVGGAVGPVVNTTKNGLAVVTFGTGTSTADLKQTKPAIFTTGQAATLVMVAKSPPLSVNAAAYWMGDAGSYPTYHRTSGNGNWTESFGRSNPTNDAGNYSAYAADLWYVHFVRINADGSSWRVQHNTTQVLSSSSAAGTVYGPASWWLGGDGVLDQGFRSHIAEWRVYNFALSDANITTVFNYLNWKWALGL